MEREGDECKSQVYPSRLSFDLCAKKKREGHKSLGASEVDT